MNILSKPGSIGISIAGVDDPFKLIANVLMMAEHLFGNKTTENNIIHALKKEGIDTSLENINKVKSFFNEREWKSEDNRVYKAGIGFVDPSSNEEVIQKN